MRDGFLLSGLIVKISQLAEKAVCVFLLSD